MSRKKTISLTLIGLTLAAGFANAQAPAVSTTQQQIDQLRQQLDALEQKQRPTKPQLLQPPRVPRPARAQMLRSLPIPPASQSSLTTAIFC